MSQNTLKGKVLVTGGAGFIGGHLVDALILRGYEVVVLDLLAKPTHDGKLPKWFNKKATFIKGDVRDKKDWVKALKGVSVVFHIAGYMDFLTDYSTYFDVNTKSTALLYEVINEYKFPVKKIIIASSQAVYGEGKYMCKKHGMIYPSPRDSRNLEKGIWEIQCPKCGRDITSMLGSEDDQSIQYSPYSISKRSLEQTAFFFGDYLGIPSFSLRYTIVHGPHQSVRHFYSGALRQFTAMALAHGAISMHEDGNQKRDFIHINDLINAHITILENEKIKPGIYNIGSGRSTTIRELAEEVCKVLRVPYSPRFDGYYIPGNARHSVADISKLKKYGWKPKKKLIDNITDYVAWVKDDLSIQEGMKRSLKQLKINNSLKRSKK